ncbi:MAG: DsrE family protein [Chloroflexota bacterium]|nr:DsrE family protein [Chloroflexota bacterium]
MWLCGSESYPFAELVETFIANDDQTWVCSPCFKRRGLAEDKLVGNAPITGAACIFY